ncbi:MAG TPA: glycine cleavage system protein GcvH [Polyangiaceae bacterium]
MSSAKDVRTDRFYTREHEWAKSADAEVLVGISAFAVDQLGDITLVDLTIKPGDKLEKHQVFGTVESVKTLSDLFAPIAGRVTRINTDLADHPEWVNDDCWEKAWMVAITPEAAPIAGNDLLDPVAYARHLEESEH